MSYTIGRMSYDQPLKAGQTSILHVNFSRTSTSTEERFVAYMYASKGNTSNFSKLTTSTFKLIKGKASLDVDFYPEFKEGGEFYTKIVLYKAKYSTGTTTTGYSLVSRIGKYPDTVEGNSSTSIIGFNQEDVVYMNQEDDSYNGYANRVYWEDGGINRYLAESGCSPTSTAMAISTVKNTFVNPVELFRKTINIPGCYHSSVGSYQKLVYEGCKAYGASYDWIGNSKTSIENALKNNKVIVFGVDDVDNALTKGGHVVLIHGIETIGGKDYFLIADPNMDNSNYSRDSYAVIDDYKNDGFVKIEADYLMRHFTQATAVYR